ncbi:MAG: phage terminase large subunit [Alphaproteobacteria bacterium]|nr:phage terminase large subunit [Alphaproteobacteria bacterium]
MTTSLSRVRAAYLRLLRTDFSSFVAKCVAMVHPGAVFAPSWHLGHLAAWLEAARSGEEEARRLIVTMPPRGLKSLIVSVAWPAWMLGQDPKARILCASYARALAVKHSLDCRMMLQSPWYRELFGGTLLASDQNEKEKFMTTARGFRLATSVEGMVTGEGGDVLIVDDPLTPLQAMSPTARALAVEWFEHSFLSRLDDKRRGVAVVVMQRLHAEDLAGHLLAHRQGWKLLSYPAVAEAPMTYVWPGGGAHERVVGDVLHAAREDAATLARIRAEIGAYAFAAQYQQQPVAAGSGMIKPEWLRRKEASATLIHPSPSKKEDSYVVHQSWDTAFAVGGAADYSVCLTFAEEENGWRLLHVARGRWDFPELRRRVIALAQAWNPQAVLIEDKGSGQSLIQELRSATRLPVVAVRPRQDKVTRLAAVSPLIEAGKLALPRGAVWAAEFEMELLAFPHGAHDDQVDALSQYLTWARDRRKQEARIREL